MGVMYGTEVATATTVVDMIDEYDRKNAAMDDELQAFERAFGDLELAASIHGTYAEPVIDRRPYVHADRLRKTLLKSGWKAIYNRLQIDRIASAKDRQLFERTLQDPPPLTLDNAKATFGDYLMRPRHHILRGLAEVFAGLDPAYRSHSKVKIGVKGLPKRVILTSFGDYSGTYGRDRLRDIVNALAAYRNQPLMEQAEFIAIGDAHKNGDDAHLDGRPIHYYRNGKSELEPSPDRGLTIRRFGNGNAHVFFAPQTLRDINMALAEYYGEVLPDVDPDAPERAPSTAVAKDLQFYWSPPDVISRALEFAGVHDLREWGRNPPPSSRILEPSCGDGRIMDAIRERGHAVFGIEYHPGRAAQSRAKGHSVLTANFLDQPATPDFDKVMMNPPFYGRHYVKHVRHALRFLKPGGRLVAILPATARYDHGELDGEWDDLPVGSFAEAGTNVPTVLLRMQVKDLRHD